MKTKFKLGMMAAMSFSMLMGSAQAVDTTINISGKVVASPCQVDGNTSINVDLGQSIEAVDLAPASSSTPWVPFTISMKNCPVSTTNVVATFSGTPDAAGSLNLYKSTGVATNVAVELQSSDAAHKPLGDAQTLSIPRSAGNTAVFPLQSRVWSKGNATTGTVASVVSVTFSYN